jgi:hypothetical protein
MLAEHQLARRTDPATSHAAARGAVRFSGSHKARIMEALKEGPRTAAGIAAMTGLSVVQVDRRLPELQAQGKAAPIASVVVGGYRVWKASE